MAMPTAIPICDRRSQPFVGVRRRHPYVDDRYIRPVLDDRLDQRRTVSDRGHHLVAVLRDEPDQALPEKYGVVRDDHSQGSSAWIRVGPPGGLTTLS